MSNLLPHSRISRMFIHFDNIIYTTKKKNSNLRPNATSVMTDGTPTGTGMSWMLTILTQKLREIDPQKGQLVNDGVNRRL